jgi:hypothetical protein
MKRTALFALAIVLLGAAAYVLWPSEERRIKVRLADIAHAVSQPANEPELARVTRIATLRRYLADDLRVRYGGMPEVTSRDAVLALMARWIAPGGATVELVDVQVEREGAADTAEVTATVKLSGRNPHTDESVIDAREAAVTLAKRGGEWVVTSAETRETLTRP